MKVCSLLAAVAIIGIIAIATTNIARAQDSDVKPDPAPVKVAAVDPAAVEAVHNCFSACMAVADQFAVRIITSAPSGDKFCRYWQHGIQAVQRCAKGCDGVRAAYGNPDSYVRDFLKAKLATQVARYEVVTACSEKWKLADAPLMHH